MHWYALLTSALLMWLLLPPVESESCERGWFGEQCKFQCHCFSSDVCGRNGECPYFGRCALGYFGPSCQYKDLVKASGSPTNDQFYTDGDDTTCNPDTTNTSLTVALNKSSPSMWIRIFVRSERYLLNFTLTLNNGLACSNERRYIVDSKVVDITCDNQLLNRITLDGRSISYICSILISGGRNVALKQPTIQSPMVAGGINHPGNAVDGSSDNVYEHGSCTFSHGAQRPWWSVTLPRPMIVLNAKVVNRNSQLSRLDGFILETFRADGNRTNKFVNTGPSGLEVYYVELASTDPITSVKITAATEILSMCEVQLFGDALCPEGTHGLDCQDTCACRPGEMCSAVTGLCARGCPDGFYGLNCSRPCPNRCYQGGCTPRDGVCSSCFPGFTGPQCQQTCVTGTYGHQCSMNCSEHCLDVCNNQNGACKCETDYTGYDCSDQECPSGMYGNQCSRKCSMYCLRSECMAKSGDCIECVGYREGNVCEDCPPKFYGSLCESPCSEFCLNSTCHKDTGFCPTCTNGYQGAQCSHSPNAGFSYYWLIALPVAALVIVTVLIVFNYGCRRRKASEDAESESDG